jgi:NADH-quinone oxidoreductase subunit I
LPDGKKKMKLDKYMYDLGSCTFCGLCVQVCPTNAIMFSNDFEQAVFTREKLVKQLNYLPEKDDAPAPAPAAKPAAPAAAKPAAPVEKPAAPAADETKQEPKENKE